MPGLTLGASTVPDAAFVVHELPVGVAGILVELDTRTPSWRAALDRAVRESAGRPLDVRIVADDADADAVREAVEAAAAAGPVARVGAFAGRGHVTEPDLWAALTDAAAHSLPEAELLGGARSHFTELNRRHGDLPHDLPSLAFSMTPQMHATERAQLVESIAMQAVVVRDAARIAAGRPLHVGPITLRSRFNAVATSAASGQADPTLADGYGAQLAAGATDARQSSVALAAWTVASFAAVATADVGDGGLVADVAYYETVGPRGIRNDSADLPVARAVELLASLAGGRLLAPLGPAPDGLWAVGSIRADGTWRALVASLADRPVRLAVRHGGRTLERTVAPYEVAAIDSTDR